MKDPRIPKNFNIHYADLCDYAELLRDAIKFVEEGKSAYFKTMLFIIRVLVADFSTGKPTGLLFKFIKEFNIPLKIIIKGKEFLPSSRPESKERRVTLETYMNTELLLAGKNTTYGRYMYILSSELAIHSSDKVKPELVSSVDILIGGYSIADRYTLMIGRTVMNACNTLIREYKKIKDQKEPIISK